MSSDGRRVDRRRRRFIKLASAAGITGLAGCSGDGNGGNGNGGNGNGGDENVTDETIPEDADTVLTFWTLFGGGDGVVMADMIDKFNEERPLGDNVGIQRQRIPWDEYYDTLYTSMVGDEAPDMAIMHGSYLRSYDNVLTDFSDYIDFSLTDEYLDTFEDFVTIDGSINALPLDYHPAGIYYNKDIFEEAGLDPEDTPSNWEEFKEAGDTIAAETDNDVWVPSVYNEGVSYYRAWSGWVTQAGGQIWEDDYAAPAFDNDVALEMTELFWDMTSDEWGWAPPTAEENWGDQSFQNGDLAMVTNGTWYVGALNEVEDLNWGFFKPFVAPNKQEDAAWADGHTVVLPRNPDRDDDRTELAAEALHWLTTENPEWGYEAGHLPASRAIHESGDLEQAEFYDETLSAYLEMAEDDQYFFHPRVSSGDPNNAGWYDWLMDVWAHNTEPQEAIDSGMATVENAMD